MKFNFEIDTIDNGFLVKADVRTGIDNHFPLIKKKLFVKEPKEYKKVILGLLEEGHRLNKEFDKRKKQQKKNGI